MKCVKFKIVSVDEEDDSSLVDTTCPNTTEISMHQSPTIDSLLPANRIPSISQRRSSHRDPIDRSSDQFSGMMSSKKNYY